MDSEVNCCCRIKTLDLSKGRFHDLLDSEGIHCKCHDSLFLHKNDIDFFPKYFIEFLQLSKVDISNNKFTDFPNEICIMSNLKIIIAKCNEIEDKGIPDKLSLLINLEKIDLSGNRLTRLPTPITELKNLKDLDLGGNSINCIGTGIKKLRKLENLYLGGNQLSDIPAEFGLLSRLRILNLSDNRLETLPSTLCNLRLLEHFSLHNNLLNTLPRQILHLRRLKELSLRNNPLVRHFVRTLDWQVPSLLELSGRAVLCNHIPINEDDLPSTLVNYLASSHTCANTNCGGVYFTSCVEHVKFKDFCGKFRMPLLDFLCSPRCENYIDTTSDESDDEVSLVRKVLLG